jgi:hypothetical protein
MIGSTAKSRSPATFSLTAIGVSRSRTRTRSPSNFELVRVRQQVVVAAGPSDDAGNVQWTETGRQTWFWQRHWGPPRFTARRADTGYRWTYRLVEVLSGKPLDQFFEERIFRPLGMQDTAFFVPEEKWNRLAVLYTPKKGGGIEPSTSPAQENFKRKPTLLLAGAGSVSTLDDYARFVAMLLNDGELEGVRILGRKSVERMRSDHLGALARTAGMPAEGYGFGLTFAVNLGPGKSANVGSEGAYNWGGAAGTSFWIDPKEHQQRRRGRWPVQEVGLRCLGGLTASWRRPVACRRPLRPPKRASADILAERRPLPPMRLQTPQAGRRQTPHVPQRGKSPSLRRLSPGVIDSTTGSNRFTP